MSICLKSLFLLIPCDRDLSVASLGASSSTQTKTLHPQKQPKGKQSSISQPNASLNEEPNQAVSSGCHLSKQCRTQMKALPHPPFAPHVRPAVSSPARLPRAAAASSHPDASPGALARSPGRLLLPISFFGGQKRCLGVKEQKHSQSLLLHVPMNAWRWEKHTQSARGNSLHLALPSQSYQLRSFKKPKNPPGRFCLFKLTTSTDLRGLQGPFEPASSQGREPVEKFKHNPGCNSTSRTSSRQNLQGQPT